MTCNCSQQYQPAPQTGINKGIVTLCEASGACSQQSNVRLCAYVVPTLEDGRYYKNSFVFVEEYNAVYYISDDRSELPFGSSPRFIDNFDPTVKRVFKNQVIYDIPNRIGYIYNDDGEYMTIALSESPIGDITDGDGIVVEKSGALVTISIDPTAVPTAAQFNSLSESVDLHSQAISSLQEGVSTNTQNISSMNTTLTATTAKAETAYTASTTAASTATSAEAAANTAITTAQEAQATASQAAQAVASIDSKVDKTVTDGDITTEFGRDSGSVSLSSVNNDATAQLSVGYGSSPTGQAPYATISTTADGAGSRLIMNNTGVWVNKGGSETIDGDHLVATMGDLNDRVSTFDEELEAALETKADKATTLAGYGIEDTYTKTQIDTSLSTKADKATTLAGYGISDAYTKTQADSLLATKAGKATTLAGYGITDAYTKTQVDTSLSAKANAATTLAGYNISDAYTKTQIDGMLTSTMTYKGSVATIADLPSSGNNTGDTWYVTGEQKNYAWDGTKWNVLGGMVDLSGYYTKTETDTLLNDKATVAQVNAKQNTLTTAQLNAANSGITSALVTKLNGIAAGAEVNVNADWNATSGDAQILNKPSLATVATSGSYSDLSNKPTIPTVNNATLTIQKNGTTVSTFTANSSSNVTANITVPTATSALTNDSGYITKSVSDLTNYTKTSSLATVATSGSYSDLSNKPSLATVATSGSYNDLSNKPTIPTVNNATLTIQKNGTTVKTFTANASSNVTANITVPTFTYNSSTKTLAITY